MRTTLRFSRWDRFAYELSLEESQYRAIVTRITSLVSQHRDSKERERVQTQRGEVRKSLHGKKEFRYSRINSQKSRRYRLNKIPKSPFQVPDLSLGVLPTCLKVTLARMALLYILATPLKPLSPSFLLTPLFTPGSCRNS